MKILLDTNIIIHREASSVVHDEVGVLFRWIDNLNYKKYVHPITVDELSQYRDPKTRKTIKVKLENYNVLKTTAPIAKEVQALSDDVDKSQNNINDTAILNELFSNRVDIIITEDKNLRHKASFLGISEKVFTIDAFLEKVIAENPDFTDYNILSVKKEHFGNIDINQPFFASLKTNYQEFVDWFNKKADETAYACYSDNNLMAFLYLKVENERESYTDIEPTLPPKKRLKIGTMKVTLNGFRLGERFLKIVFDNALRFKVDEIYVTLFSNSIEQERLINLLEEFGFYFHGYKTNHNGRESVYI
ncbi:MAG: PIN domain-containing protein, partial [Desulfobacteraceae bacterium]